jgi:hypothetical protein
MNLHGEKAYKMQKRILTIPQPPRQPKKSNFGKVPMNFNDMYKEEA